VPSPKKVDIEAITGDYSPDGLSSAKVRERLEKYGENAFAKERFSALRSFFKQLFDPLNFILIFAAALSFYMKEISDGVVILVIVVLNSVLSFVQEFRSAKAVEKLSELIKHQVLVVRDRKQISIEVSQLVPGDTVILKGGDVVPADIRVMEADNLSANESQLTGESVPVTKIADAKKDVRSGMLFSGSVVERGYCKGVVFATGNQTELGKIALLSKNTAKTTQYQKSLSEFSFSVLRIIGVTIILILAAKIFQTHNMNDLSRMVLFTIALAMTVVPEALPMIMTVNLSNGALQLAKRKVIVKRLSAIEDLGRINILCTDKTGTLTQDKLTITDIVSDDAEMMQKLAIASIDDLKVKNEKLSSFDQAFVNYVPEKLKEQAINWPQLLSLPFDPAARRKRVIVEDPKTKTTYLVTIGSLEAILKLTKEHGKSDYDKLMAEPEQKGKRQLALAYKEIYYKPGFDICKNETNMTFAGFANMVDPLRPTSKATIKMAADLGVEVKVLTGDSKETAIYVGCEVGLIQEGELVYSGEELEKMTAREFDKAIKECSVFARVTPEQKYDIIKRLKVNNVVGYQGDGINDAPSLKLADASIAVNGATDVAKSSADIILMENDLKVVVNGIRYGRSIFVNINKYIKHAMVGDLGNFFSLAFFYVVFAADLPMLPIQLLVANLLQDFPLLTIVSDGVDDDEVKSPLTTSQVKPLMRTSLILGTFTAIYYLVYFLCVGTAVNAQTQTNLFIFFTLTQLLIIISLRNKGRFLWQGVKPSKWLLGTILLFAIGSVAITYIPLTANIMGFAPLPMFDLAILLVVSVGFLFVLDFVKVWLGRLQAHLKWYAR